MTEDEAKTKWCFAARLGNQPGCNRYPNQTERADEEPYARCIASACMAWRVQRDVATNAETGISRTVVLGGYCGLAGAPQ